MKQKDGVAGGGVGLGVSTGLLDSLREDIGTRETSTLGNSLRRGGVLLRNIMVKQMRKMWVKSPGDTRQWRVI